jgi:hypothetical protein
MKRTKDGSVELQQEMSGWRAYQLDSHSTIVLHAGTLTRMQIIAPICQHSEKMVRQLSMALSTVVAVCPSPAMALCLILLVVARHAKNT